MAEYPSAELDWREVLKKYMDIVGRNEGTYFLFEWDWSEAEFAELVKAIEEIEKDV